MTTFSINSIELLLIGFIGIVVSALFFAAVVALGVYVGVKLAMKNEKTTNT